MFLLLNRIRQSLTSICSSLAAATRFASGDAKALAAVVRGLSCMIKSLIGIAVLSLIVICFLDALILNPIAAGFTVVAFLVSFSSHTVLGILASLLSFVAFLITAIAFAVSSRLISRHSDADLN